MKILKKLLGGDTKIHVDEVVDSQGILLGESVIVESDSNEKGNWVIFGNGFAIVTKNSILLTYNQSDRLSGIWEMPIALKADSRTVITPTLSDVHTDAKYRGFLGAGMQSDGKAQIRMWAQSSLSFVSGDIYNCRATATGFVK